MSDLPVPRNHAAGSIVVPTAVMVVILAMWQVIANACKIPEYILPAPDIILRRVILDSSVLFHHGWVTLQEVLLGYAAGTTVALAVAVSAVHWPLAHKTLLPVSVWSQTVPKLAIAPLFLVWFGYGILPKVLIVTLAVFFPILINTMTGLSGIDPRLLDLMKLFKATKWQVLMKVRVPSAMPSVLAGLKISTTAAVIAAVVGEWVGASAGLGFLIMSANSQLDTPLVFAALATLSVIGLTLFGLIGTLEYLVLNKYGRTRGNAGIES